MKTSFTTSSGAQPAPKGATLRPALVSALVVLPLLVGGCAFDGASPNGNGNNTQTLGEQQDGIMSTLMTAAADAENKRNYESAARFYARILESKPNDPTVLVALSRNLRYASSPTNAVSLMEAEAGKHFEHPGVTLEHGKALLASGREADAIIKLQDAVQVAPKNWEAHSALGIALDATGAFARAQQSFRHALLLDPENAFVLNNLAMSLALSGNMDLAVSTLERAAVLNRNNAQIRQNLALLYGVQGNTEKARALAAMDLDASEVESNLTFYRRFEGQP